MKTRTGTPTQDVHEALQVSTPAQPGQITARQQQVKLKTPSLVEESIHANVVARANTDELDKRYRLHLKQLDEECQAQTAAAEAASLQAEYQSSRANWYRTRTLHLRRRLNRAHERMAQAGHAPEEVSESEEDDDYPGSPPAGLASNPSDKSDGQ